MRRIIIIAAALLLALLAGRDAAMAYWRSLAPDQVTGNAANDPVVRLRASDKLYAEPDKFREQSAAIAASARAVLQRTPLSSLALRQLGTAERLERRGTGEKQIALAEEVSRRDLPSELLAINQAAQRNDVVKALSHYEHALSVHPEIGAKLLPVLASGLIEPEVRRALLPYAKKPWLRDFVVNAANFDVAPLPLMEFYADLQGKVPTADLQAGTIQTIKWLAANQQSAILGALVSRMPGIAPDAFDPLGFDDRTSDARFKPLAWDLSNNGTIGSIVTGNRLSVEVSPENTGQAAYRLMFFAPGQYQVSQTISFVPNVPRARLTWKVTCLGKVRSTILNEELPVANASQLHVMRIVVPQGCEAQDWVLLASADRSQFTSVAQIDGLGAMKQ
jgi:hypothetical protein